ncbi:hypothetical protein ASPZODRAFT_128692 [Penicilliopsis zonata CBS 506.65]|uniref:HNH nuclease domain-containing protein n=1 Tax=Penicilliopsis zonata CBS 506.65 TaxID=1073090 RepID=A0A1L9SS88_9EURO|nr:hypothetical protein ASPZODRAFT_128692 [Penicilliopsis zonata CBS 506.65]OJJ50078.1 hypothetical protein ASPZODRAFT_128692 [Penicilliopsis zonata CBS 506.65]
MVLIVRLQIQLWKDLGLVNYQLTSSFNAIALCPNCHCQFDCGLDPGLVFIPTDLAYFLDFEVKDQERRRQAAALGEVLQRQVPSAETYRLHQITQGKVAANAIGGLYQPVVLKTYIMIGSPFDVTQFLQRPRQWHGAPLACLRRGFLILGGGRLGALSREQRLDLQRLRDLYFLSDKEGSVDETRRRAHPQTATAEEEGSEQAERQPKRQDRGLDEHDQGQQPPFWELGPEVTAEDAIRRFGPLIT